MQAILFSPYVDESNVLQVILQQAGFVVRTYRSLDQAIETWPENPADLILVVRRAGSGDPDNALLARLRCMAQSNAVHKR